MWFVLCDKSTGFVLIPSLIKAFIEHQILSYRMAAKSGNWFFSSVFNPLSLEEEYNHTLIQSSIGIDFLVAKFRGHCRVAPNYGSKWALKEYLKGFPMSFSKGGVNGYRKMPVNNNFFLKHFVIFKNFLAVFFLKFFYDTFSNFLFSLLSRTHIEKS